MTYTRDIIVVALSFGKKTIPDLPCKDWWTLAFIVGNAFHYARGGHSWLGSTNGTRLDRARLIVPAKKKKSWKKSWKSHVSKSRHDCIDWRTFHFCLTTEIWDCLVTFLRLCDISCSFGNIPCIFQVLSIINSCSTGAYLVRVSWVL